MLLLARSGLGAEHSGLDDFIDACSVLSKKGNAQSEHYLWSVKKWNFVALTNVTTFGQYYSVVWETRAWWGQPPE